MVQSQVAVAKANSLARGFESAYHTSIEEDVDITAVGWAGFCERMLSSITNPALIHLARYALNDALLLITTIQNGLPADMPKEHRRQLLHAHAEHIYAPPASMTDDGKGAFLDHANGHNVAYNPGATADGVGMLTWTGFDFDYYTSSNSGCPALSVEPSENFYARGNDRQASMPPE